MIKNRTPGRPVFPFSALTYRALVPEDQIVDIGLFAPWAPLLSVSIPSILCAGVGENVSRIFAVALGQKPCPAVPFSGIFSCPDAVLFLSVFVQFRLIAAKIGKTKFSIGGKGLLFHFHDTITVQILMEVLPMAYQIGSGCVSCGACADVCPVGAISQGDDHYVIDANSCLDCGTCSDTCPNGAISPAE